MVVAPKAKAVVLVVVALGIALQNRQIVLPPPQSVRAWLGPPFSCERREQRDFLTCPEAVFNSSIILLSDRTRDAISGCKYRRGGRFLSLLIQRRDEPCREIAALTGRL